MSTRVVNEIMWYLEQKETDPVKVRETIEYYLRHHDEAAEAKFFKQLQQMTIFVATEIISGDINTFRLVGWTYAIKLWLSMVFRPQKTVAKISAMACIVLPKYIDKYKDEYRETIKEMEEQAVETK